MLLFIILTFIELIPFIFIFGVPVFASFCDSDTVLRFSLLSIIHALLSSVIPAACFTTVPCFNSILFGLLLFLPVNITPSACIIGYSVALWLAEPLLLVTEAVQLLLLVMLLGNYVLTNLEDLDEDETKKWKFLLLTVSGVLYSITVHFLMKIFALNNDMAYVVQILTVLILLISLLMHAQMWYSDIGVITDAAFLVMASVVLLYWACAEMPQSKEQQSPVTEPNTSTAWNKIDIQQSYLSVLYWMFRNSIDNLAECFELLRRFASLGFLCGMALRVWSISLLVNWIKSYILRQVTFNTFMVKTAKTGCYSGLEGCTFANQ